MLLLICFAAIVCNSVYRGLSVLVSDGSAFDYDHNLPRNYIGKTTRNLGMLQGACIRYAQHHKGSLPPMQAPAVTLKALVPYLTHNSDWCGHYPATRTPFTPNATLSGRKMGAVSHGGAAILFYDANPPAGYRESYYVTIKGAVGHVPVASLPKLLANAKEADERAGGQGILAARLTRRVKEGC